MLPTDENGVPAPVTRDTTCFLLGYATKYLRRATVADAAQEAQLSEDEVLWALQEYGFCETEKHLITVLGDA